MEYDRQSMQTSFMFALSRADTISHHEAVFTGPSLCLLGCCAGTIGHVSRLVSVSFFSLFLHSSFSYCAVCPVLTKPFD